MERADVRHSEILYETVEFVESKVASELWTRLEADIEYLRLSRRFPEFKFALSHPTMQVRDAIAMELLKSKDRNRTAFTNGGASPVKVMTKARTQPA